MIGYNRKSIPSDVQAVAPFMRQADKDEVAARDPNMTPEQALQLGYDLSAPCNTMVLTKGERPVGMWGVVPVNENARVGVLWMLGTDDLVSDPKAARRLLVECKKLLPVILSVYPVLTNVIDSRNLIHLKFIEWLGFEIYDTNPVDQNGVKFYPFRLTEEIYNDRWR